MKTGTSRSVGLARAQAPGMGTGRSLSPRPDVRV